MVQSQSTRQMVICVVHSIPVRLRLAHMAGVRIYVRSPGGLSSRALWVNVVNVTLSTFPLRSNIVIGSVNERYRFVAGTLMEICAHHFICICLYLCICEFNASVKLITGLCSIQFHIIPWKKQSSIWFLLNLQKMLSNDFHNGSVPVRYWRNEEVCKAVSLYINTIVCILHGNEQRQMSRIPRPGQQWYACICLFITYIYDQSCTTNIV